MSRALLAFNPETSPGDSNVLLFGVRVPRPVHGSGFSAIEELNLASHFLEARSGPAMAALVEYIARRAGRAAGGTIPAALRVQLMRAATVVNDALRSNAEQGSPLSPEGIFGAEFEGLSPEDQEFEAARRFVRFAGELSRAAFHAGRGSPSGLSQSELSPAELSPAELSPAERMAVRRFAPGLQRALNRSAASFDTRSGRRPGW